jgi:glycerate kinase
MANHAAQECVRKKARTSAPVVLVAPDSYKGSLSAIEAAEAMRAGVLRAWPHAVVRMFPMADGGEGMIDSLISCGGRRKSVLVRDARGVERETVCGELPNGVIAIESAQIVGITDAANTSIPVGERSTLGVGDAIRKAMDASATRITVGLGGSATNDGGAGLLVALGLRLLDDEGNELAPTPEAMAGLARVDAAGLDERLKGIDLQVLSDVNSPLTGEAGATAVFGPQKGVTKDQVPIFDARLAHFADCVEAAMGRAARELPGSGAAGGLGFALRMLGATLRPGAEVIADVIGLEDALADVDLVMTGEGASDQQTVRGKTPYVVATRARKHAKPVVLVSGYVRPDALAELDQHFAACFSCVPGPVELAWAMRNAALCVANTAEQVVRLAGCGAARGVSCKLL